MISPWQSCRTDAVVKYPTATSDATEYWATNDGPTTAS